MINNKYIRWLIICSCVLIFTIMSITSGIMVGNVFHTEHCNVHNCSVCSLIHMLADFLKNIGLIKNNILILIVILPLIQLINIGIQKIRRLTQVELKVVQIK